MAKAQNNKRTFSFSALVKKKWGKEWTKPDVAYQFSNGRRFYSTDRAESGVYKKT